MFTTVVLNPVQILRFINLVVEPSSCCCRLFPPVLRRTIKFEKGNVYSAESGDTFFWLFLELGELPSPGVHLVLYHSVICSGINI